MDFDHTKNFLFYYGKSMMFSYRRELAKRNYSQDIIQGYEVKVFGNMYQLVFDLKDYWKWIEYGRKPGKMPPIDKIVGWIKKKNIKPRDPLMSNKTLGFLISRKIGRDGIPPKRLWDNAAKIVNQSFEKQLNEALSKDIIQFMKKEIKI